MLDFLMKLEDGLPDVLGVQLVVTGKFRDHGVISVDTIPWHFKTCCSIASSLVSTLPVLFGP